MPCSVVGLAWLLLPHWTVAWVEQATWSSITLWGTGGLKAVFFCGGQAFWPILWFWGRVIIIFSRCLHIGAPPRVLPLFCAFSPYSCPPSSSTLYGSGTYFFISIILLGNTIYVRPTSIADFQIILITRMSKRGGPGCLRSDLGCLYEITFETFLPRMTGSPGHFGGACHFKISHSGPDSLPRNILKHP